MDEHLHVQSGYAHTDLPSALLHSHSAHLVYYNKSEGKSDITCSLKSQIENNKDETSPNISWGMDVYLHVRIVYAHKDLLSALLHNHSARRYKYLHVLIMYAHADSLSALQYNRIQHKVRLEKKTLHQNHIL